MVDTDIIIRNPEPQDEAAWRVLWKNYTDLFGHPTITDDVTKGTWARIMDFRHPLGAMVASKGPDLCGFVHYVIHPRTWSLQDSCYMEDLYVAPEFRRRSVALRLCAALKLICREEEISRIYWHTEDTNTVAQEFYKSVGMRDNFLRYSMRLP